MTTPEPDDHGEIVFHLDRTPVIATIPRVDMDPATSEVSMRSEPVLDEKLARQFAGLPGGGGDAWELAIFLGMMHPESDGHPECDSAGVVDQTGAEPACAPVGWSYAPDSDDDS